MSVPTLLGAHLWLDAFLGDAAAAGAPSTFHVALLTGDPREAGVEVSGGGYARVELANTDAVWGAAAAGKKQANAVFPDATGDWSTARWWAAAASSGSTSWCLAGRLSETVNLADGDNGPTITCVARLNRDF